MDLFNEVNSPADSSTLERTHSHLDGCVTFKSECRKECELIGLYNFSNCPNW